MQPDRPIAHFPLHAAHNDSHRAGGTICLLLMLQKRKSGETRPKTKEAEGEERRGLSTKGTEASGEVR